MRPIATDVPRRVVSMSVWARLPKRCVCSHGCTVHKAAEPIEMPFGGLTHVNPTNRVGLDGVSVGQIHSQSRIGDAAYCHITLDT